MKIIEIKSKDTSIITVSYVMTTNCTYACRYCPDNLHNGKNKNIDIKELSEFLDKLKDKTIFLTLNGGECTTHPQFVDVITMLKSKPNLKLCVQTNAVRSVRFFEEVRHLVDLWCFTLHPSQHTLDLDKIKAVTDYSFTTVLVMMDPDHWATSVDWFNQVSQLENVKVTPLKIINGWAGADFSTTYTEEQDNFLFSTDSVLRLTEQRKDELIKTHSWLLEMDPQVFWEDGTSSSMDPYMLIKEGKNNFQGWKCSAGSESILISEDKTVSWANCGIKVYPNYKDVTLEDLNTQRICKFAECMCTSDIRASKVRS